MNFVLVERFSGRDVSVILMIVVKLHLMMYRKLPGKSFHQQENFVEMTVIPLKMLIIKNFLLIFVLWDVFSREKKKRV